MNQAIGTHPGRLIHAVFDCAGWYCPRRAPASPANSPAWVATLHDDSSVSIRLTSTRLSGFRTFRQHSGFAVCGSQPAAGIDPACRGVQHHDSWAVPFDSGGGRQAGPCVRRGTPPRCGAAPLLESAGQSHVPSESCAHPAIRSHPASRLRSIPRRSVFRRWGAGGCRVTTFDRRYPIASPVRTCDRSSRSGRYAKERWWSTITSLAGGR